MCGQHDHSVPPERSTVLCLDQMGPESAQSLPGQQWVPAIPAVDATDAQPAERAKQELDYGRRGKGYVLGAFQPDSGDALTQPCGRRTTANWIDFLERVERWVPARCKRLYALVITCVHRATDVLLFTLTHPRWAFVFQPKYAAYLNLCEPWWTNLRSLALKGRRFECWQQIEHAVAAATACWNRIRHPYMWGSRRRHQPRRSPGIALVPAVR